MKITIEKKVFEFKKGMTGHEIAQEVLGDDEKKIVCLKIDGNLIDMFLPIEKDTEISFVNLSSDDGRAVLRHTTSHILAQAVQSIYPTARLTIGPSIENGFYYDIDFKTPISVDDLPKIETEMKKIIKANFKIVRKEVSREDALALAKADNEPYKVELIEAIPKGEKITTYTQGEWYDICRGPHLKSTGMVKAFKLTKIAGAYWRGDEKNKMLTRIYGVAFESKQEMDDYFKQIEEAEKRDHRKLGPALDLFFMHDTAPGCPYWLPHGQKLYRTMLEFWQHVHDESGYTEVSAPIVNSSLLWKTSGHWDHYKEDMFLIEQEKDKQDDDSQFALKPMSCPNMMLIYKTKPRSYRDLPLRLNDTDVIHRFEKSGVTKGLFRVRQFRQDDSHNFISFNQIESEFEHLFDLAEQLYSVFGIKFKPMLSTRPQKYLGDKRTWDKCEKILKGILDRKFGKGNYDIDEGGGAFYGPKIDLWMKDALGRPWQTGTFQLDMQLPERFELFYSDKDGSRKIPIVIHRAIYGSFERFIGILIEHFGGAFPFWVAPTQVGIVPIGEDHLDYAKEIASKLKKHGIRVELAEGDVSMNAKVKNFTLLKVPYTLVLGNKEMENGTVSVRLRSGKQVFAVPFAEFEKSVIEQVEQKNIDVRETF